MLLGTPYYASPEQARRQGDLANARSDVYSFGVTLHELIALRKPFEGDSAANLQRTIGRSDEAAVVEQSLLSPNDARRRYASARCSGSDSYSSS